MLLLLLLTFRGYLAYCVMISLVYFFEGETSRTRARGMRSNTPPSPQSCLSVHTIKERGIEIHRCNKLIRTASIKHLSHIQQQQQFRAYAPTFERLEALYFVESGEFPSTTENGHNNCTQDWVFQSKG